MSKRNGRIQFYWSRKDDEEIHYLIEHYVTPKSLIWDPFMGSGTTFFSINNYPCKFVGTEINEMPYESTIFNLNKATRADIDNAKSLLSQITKKYAGFYSYALNKSTVLLEKVVFEDSNFDHVKEIKVSSENGKAILIKGLNIPLDLADQIKERYRKYSEVINTIDIPNLEENSRIAIKGNMRISDIFSPINFFILYNTKEDFVNNYILRNLLSSILHILRLTDLKSQSQFPYWIPKTNLVDRNIFIQLNKQFAMYEQYQKELSSKKLSMDFKNLDKSDAYLINMPIQKVTDMIPDKSIDFVITDPPYYDQIAYSEYLKIWEYFLNYKSDLDDEIVVSNNKLHDKTKENYLKSMKESFEIISKKLKDDGKIFMYFKDSNIEKMEKIKEIINNVGMCYTETIHLPGKIYTYKQNTTQKTSITGNNILSFSKMTEGKKNTPNKRIITEDMSFLKQIIKGYLLEHEASTISEILNLVTDIQNVCEISQPFANSNGIAKWLDSFTTYDSISRKYSLGEQDSLVNNLVLGNSLEILKKIPDKSIDACITDPPYNIEGSRNKEIGWYKSNPLWKEEKGFNKISEKWDKFTSSSYEDFTYNWLREIRRIVKENGNVAIFGSYHNIFKIGYILEQLDFRIINSIVWYKRNAFPNITQRMFCESTEYIIWAVNNNSKKAKNWTFDYQKMKELNNGKQMRNMWDITSTPISEKKQGKHPSQKPLQVLDRLILAFTNENEIIVDPFLGSGTTALSALNNKRRYLGIDSNLDYLITANNRIENRELKLNLN